MTISNDGATILNLLSVEHPAGRILVELAQQQDKEVGDGTTSVVIVASELLKRANDLVKNKIHPTTVISGYRLACREAVRFMETQLSVKVDALAKDTLVNIAKTSMASKIIGRCARSLLERLSPRATRLTSPYRHACSDSDFFANMAVDAMLAVKTINARGEIKYPVKAVNVLKAHGKSATESVFVKGYAINVTVASQGMSLLPQRIVRETETDPPFAVPRLPTAMKKRIQGAKIACLDMNLQKQRMNLGVHVTIDDPEQLEAIRRRWASNRSS